MTKHTSINSNTWATAISNMYKAQLQMQLPFKATMKWTGKYESPIKGFPVIKACFPTGSRYICDPPVMDTDNDVIILVDDYPDEQSMNDLGWKMCRGEGEELDYPAGDFHAYRHGDLNYILTNSKDHYIRMCAATTLAKQMNLLDKKDRVHLFRFLQGKEYTYSGPLPDRGLL